MHELPLVGRLPRAQDLTRDYSLRTRPLDPTRIFHVRDFPATFGGRERLKRAGSHGVQEASIEAGIGVLNNLKSDHI